MNNKISIGLLGCGVITQRTLRGLKAILDQHGGEISAVCDPSEQNRQAVAIECGNTKVQVFASYEQMLAESDCNIIFIATPIAMHYEQVRQALLAAKHVYCHKTLAETEQKCRELGELAAAQGCCLAASPGQILVPAYARTLELIKSGELGDIVTIDSGTEATAHRYEPERADEEPIEGKAFSWEWYHKEAKGGGPLDDMYVYHLALLTELFGGLDAASVRSKVATPVIEWKGRVIEADTPDAYAGVLSFGDVLATFRASFSSNTQHTSWGHLCIRGTKACLEIERRTTLEYTLLITPNDHPARVEKINAFDEQMVKTHGEEECHVLLDMAELVVAVKEQRQVRGATAENAARVAAGISLIKRSAANNGQWLASNN